MRDLLENDMPFINKKNRPGRVPNEIFNAVYRLFSFLGVAYLKTSDLYPPTSDRFSPPSFRCFTFAFESFLF